MELARLVFGLLVAVLLPMSLGILSPRPWAAQIFTVLYAAYAIFPVLDGWKAIIVWAAAALAGLILISPKRLNPRSAVRGWANRHLKNRRALNDYLRPALSHRNLALVSGVVLLGRVS